MLLLSMFSTFALERTPIFNVLVSPFVAASGHSPIPAWSQHSDVTSGLRSLCLVHGLLYLRHAATRPKSEFERAWNLENAWIALFVDFTRPSPRRIFFSTLLVLV